MNKGYWIARLEVTDQASYDTYRALNGPAFKKYGARFLARGGKAEPREGSARSRNVVIEFPSMQAALDCYDSREYSEAKAARENAADIDLVIVEGYDGPQP
jgi:uncharacterized protein (DUF1330 family)